MDPNTALQNLTNVVEAFVGNAEQHRLLALSLAILRERLARLALLEERLAAAPLPVPATTPPSIPPSVAALQLAAQEAARPAT